METALHPDEIELIQRKCKTLANPYNVRFELGKDDITVHSSRFFDSRDLGFPLYISAQKAEEMLSKMAVYTPAFRFTLEDENSRTFIIERMSFGGHDQWYYLESGALPDLLKKYALHIEKDSFFELL